MDIIIILILSVLLVPLAIFTSGAIRIILGLAFLLFFPGYILIAALFPRKSDIDVIERLALSFGLSIAIVPLIGLVLNYTPWGIRLYPILISILVFMFITGGIAWFRRRRLSREERFTPSFGFKLPTTWAGEGRWDKVLTGLLIASVLGAVGTLIYVVATPKVGEKFTEFYILGQEEKAADYPRELAINETGTVTLGIVNHEQAPMSYRVEIAIDGEKIGEIGPIALNQEAKWEDKVAFSPTRAGPNQKVEFLLYKADAAEPYLKLHLWVDVK